MITGIVLAALWIALVVATDTFGLPRPWSWVVGGTVGFLCTFAFGPAIERAARHD